MKHACIGVALTVLLLPGMVIAAPAVEKVGLADVIQTLESPFKAGAKQPFGEPASTIVDFEADFFQEAEIASLDQVQRGRGRIVVKFEGHRSDRVPVAKFRMEYDQPTRHEFVSDGKNLWVYLPENNQVVLSDIEFTTRARADDPMTFLTGLGNLSRDFLITWAYPNTDVDGNYVLQLRPRRASPLIQQMLVVVDRDAVLEYVRNGVVGTRFPILSTTVYSPEGNSTLLEFSDIRVNRGVSDFTFRFVVPAGVEVVRPSESGFGY